MHAGYESKGPAQALAHVIEEFGEALSAAGKTARFGPSSFNPELAPRAQEKNIEWLMRELNDVELAIQAFRALVRPAAIDKWQRSVDVDRRGAA